MQHQNSLATKKVLAISSGGGHWTQMLRLSPAWKDENVTYVTTQDSYKCEVPHYKFKSVKDCNRNTPLSLIKCCFQICAIILNTQPDVIITTGAAPGLIACVVGKLLGRKTLWLDSIANADRLSCSGRLAGSVVDLWMTQWPQLAYSNGPKYTGKIF